MTALAAFSLYRGEDRALPIYLSPPQNVTGWQVEWKAMGSQDQVPLIKDSAGIGGITVIDFDNGVFLVNLAAGDTKDLQAETYWWTFHRVDDPSRTVYVSGSMYLLPSP
jgi:hypothetical protein